ncbi:MAG: hypothetical protein AB7S38_06595 [Vulcanimicrobiota bacterium]
MEIERQEGWPRQFAILLLLLSLGAIPLTAWKVGLDGVWPGWWGAALTLSLPLLMWRRGVRIDPQARLLWPWWGLRCPGLGLWKFREGESRSTAGFEHVEVEALDRGEHYKNKPMARVLLGCAGHPLQREIVDDEYADIEAARRCAERVSQCLGLELQGFCPPERIGCDGHGQDADSR